MSKKRIILSLLYAVFVVSAILMVFVPTIGIKWEEKEFEDAYHFSASISGFDLVKGNYAGQVKVKEQREYFEGYEFFYGRTLTKEEINEELGKKNIVNAMLGSVSSGGATIIRFLLIAYLACIIIIIIIIFLKLRNLINIKASVSNYIIITAFYYGFSVIFLPIIWGAGQSTYTFNWGLPVFFVLLILAIALIYAITEKKLTDNTPVKTGEIFVKIKDTIKETFQKPKKQMTATDKADLLREYGSLFREGLITEEEFIQMKKELLE